METDTQPQETSPEHPPKRRFSLNRRGKLILAAALLISAGVAIHRRGGLFEVLRLAPDRDASTLASQQGYTLVDLVRKNSDGNFNYPISVLSDTSYGVLHGITLCPSGLTALPQETVAGLWIQPPRDFPVPASAQSYADYQDVNYDNKEFEAAIGLHVTGKTPDGKIFGLRWEYFAGMSRPLLFVPIPCGYPASLKYLDVLVTDNKMRLARWRIDHLPAAEHVLAGSPQIVDHFEHGGASITAEAVRMHYAFPSYDTIHLRVYPKLVKPD
jgi:hypothetical protein